MRRAWLFGVMLAVTAAGATLVAQPVTPAVGEAPVVIDPPGADDPEGALADADVEPSAATAWRVVTLVDGGATLASGRGVTVTSDELAMHLQDAPPPLLQRYAANPRLMQELVDRLVSERLLANEARRMGLEGDPIVRAALERALVARLRATVVNPGAGAANAITDDDVRAWYDAHPERFHIPERRRVRAVFTTSRTEAADVLRQALVQRRGHYLHDFRTLATEHNHDPALLEARGEIRDIARTNSRVPMQGGAMDLDETVRDAVYGVGREGEVIGRVIPGHWRGVAGYFVVRFLNRRAPIERTLADSSEWIRSRILLERRVAAEQALVDRLERAAGVTRTRVDRVMRVEAAPTP